MAQWAIDHKDVSILARTKARALLDLWNHSHRDRRDRVSILARTKARALHWCVFHAPQYRNVSILARTKARALQFASNVMSNNV